MAEEEQNLDDQMSNLMQNKVRKVRAEGLSGNVKVLSRRALMDIVDQLIKSYGGLEHQDLISKLAEFELQKKQLETKVATLQGKVEIYEGQLTDLRKEDDDLRAKIKVEESRLPMLEEQNQVLKRTVDGLEAEAENLKRQLSENAESSKTSLEQAQQEVADLKAQLAEAEPKLKAAEDAQADADRRIRDNEALMAEMQNKIEEVQEAKEKALSDSRSKIARLEAALQESDARKKILALENELDDVKGNLEAFDIALQFMDVEPTPRFEETEAVIAEIEEALAGLPEDDERALPFREDVARSRQITSENQESFPQLVDLMNGNQGTIPVVRDLIKLMVRQDDLISHLTTLKAAAGLLG